MAIHINIEKLISGKIVEGERIEYKKGWNPAADFRLTAESPGIDKGQTVPNFSEDYKGKAPDIGAVEFGTDGLFPVRPIDIKSDKYQLNLVNNSSEEITFKIGNIPAGTKYQIIKNDVFDWIKIDGQMEGTLVPNSDLKFSVTGIPGKVKFKRTTRAELTNNDINVDPDLDSRIGNGAFILKLENGYSVPITVYLRTN